MAEAIMRMEGRTGPIKSQEKQGRGRDHKNRSDRVDGPKQLADRHLRVVGAALGVVEEEETERGGEMESGLDPVDCTGDQDVSEGDAEERRKMHSLLRHPAGLALVTPPAPRTPTLRRFCQLGCRCDKQVIKGAHRPPTAPPRKANPFARARYLRGKTSEGIA